MTVRMATSISAAAIVVIILACVLSPALSVPLNVTAGRSLSENFYANSCPQLEGIVRTELYWALRGDINLAAGLLRIFFHDCFPQGCDASILLEGWNSEQAMGPNKTLQKRALLLIEQIRFKVHQTCGPIVSCADILALATRDAVIGAGGRSYTVPLGRFDSLGPATKPEVDSLPSPTNQVSELLSAFATRGFGSTMELVALSGAHSIGRAHCDSFTDRANRREDFFAVQLQNACARNQGWVQNLVVDTPDQLDNQYYTNLLNQQGVFTSDMALARDWRTAATVQQFARYPHIFQSAFSFSMTKLSNFMPRGNFGEVRQFSCARTNSGRVAEAASDEGLAASA